MGVQAARKASEIPAGAMAFSFASPIEEFYSRSYLWLFGARSDDRDAKGIAGQVLCQLWQLHCEPRLVRLCYRRRSSAPCGFRQGESNGGIELGCVRSRR